VKTTAVLTSTVVLAFDGLALIFFAFFTGGRAGEDSLSLTVWLDSSVWQPTQRLSY